MFYSPYNSQKIIYLLRKKGIGANHLTQNYLTTYQESIYYNKHLKHFINNNKLINYNKIHNNIFSIPISSNLKKNEMDYIIENLNNL